MSKPSDGNLKPESKFEPAKNTKQSALMKEFLAMHKESLNRNNSDSENCESAIVQDKESVDIHNRLLASKETQNSFTENERFEALTHAQISDLKDIAGDTKAAVGDNLTLPDDLANMLKDKKIVSLDEKVLVGNESLSEQQQDLILQDIDSKKLNIANDLKDFMLEPKYITHDKAEFESISAEKSGSDDPLLAGKISNIIKDRNEDIKNEPDYIKQNNQDAKLDKKILDTFKSE